jgi:chaperonin GroES
MRLQPLHDNVILKVEEPPTHTPGGLILPDVAREVPVRGEVLAAGPGKRDNFGNLVPMQVQAGDVVVFPKYAGAKVTLDGEEYTVISQSALHGKLV